MGTVCMQQLLTVHKAHWGVKSAALKEALRKWIGQVYCLLQTAVKWCSSPPIPPPLPLDPSVKRCLILWIAKCEMLTFYCTHQANQCSSVRKCQNTAKMHHPTTFCQEWARVGYVMPHSVVFQRSCIEFEICTLKSPRVVDCLNVGLPLWLHSNDYFRYVNDTFNLH